MKSFRFRRSHCSGLSPIQFGWVCKYRYMLLQYKSQPDHMHYSRFCK